jgi:mono/diheme cytochrome c family protein
MTRIAGATIGIAVLLAATAARAEDKVQQGLALFTSQKCVMCHSAAGKGNKKGPLDDVGSKLKADDIRAWLTGPEAMREKTKATRTPAMKDPKLTKDQVDALVAFLLTQKGETADAAK